jgi:hypothetical protein
MIIYASARNHREASNRVLDWIRCLSILFTIVSAGMARSYKRGLYLQERAMPAKDSLVNPPRIRVKLPDL